MWQLKIPLSGATYWQNSPHNCSQSTWRLLRGSWHSSRRAAGFQSKRSTNDMRFVVRRRQELRRTSNASVEICSIDLAKKRVTLSIVCYSGKYLPILEFRVELSRSSACSRIVCGLGYRWMMKTSRRESMFASTSTKNSCCRRYYLIYSMRRSS